MNTLFLVLGLLVYVLTAMEIVKTTFSTNGGGKLTDAVSRFVWKTFFYLAGKNGRSKLLEYAGPAILIAILLTWVIGLWSGFFLVLVSDPGSVVKSSNLAVTSPLEKLYYAGFTLSSLGVGDYIASDNFWRIITGIAAFSGLAFITASITYFVPVLSAVGLQSKLSLYISSMGKTPQQILLNSWNGNSFGPFFDSTSVLCQLLMQHTMNHHAYPVIHYFHKSKPELAITRAVVLLDESHKLLKYNFGEEANLNKLKLIMLQTAIDAFLDMVKGNYLKKISPQSIAPVPNLDRLGASGLPVKDIDKTKEAFMHELHDRRKLLTDLLEMDGWSWQDIYPKES